MVSYLHAALGFPTKSTMLKAARSGWLIGWPGLTMQNIEAWFPEANKTQDGRMKQSRQGVRSTQDREPEDKEASPTKEPKKKQKDVFGKVWEPKEKVFID